MVNILILFVYNLRNLYLYIFINKIDSPHRKVSHVPFYLVIHYIAFYLTIYYVKFLIKY
jgi:hypothetical protein